MSTKKELLQKACEVLVISGGETVKLKPDDAARVSGLSIHSFLSRIEDPVKQKRAKRAGKKIYTDEVIARLRLIWAFFRYKCGISNAVATN